MSIAAGRLRHQIRIEEFIEFRNSAGERETVWQTFAVRWAAVEPISARELTAAAQTQSKTTTRIVIRRLDGLTTAMRILFRDQVFNIEGIVFDKDSGLEYATLNCSSGVADS